MGQNGIEVEDVEASVWPSYRRPNAQKMDEPKQVVSVGSSASYRSRAPHCMKQSVTPHEAVRHSA